MVIWLISSSLATHGCMLWQIVNGSRDVEADSINIVDNRHPIQNVNGSRGCRSWSHQHCWCRMIVYNRHPIQHSCMFSILLISVWQDKLAEHKSLRCITLNQIRLHCSGNLDQWPCQLRHVVQRRCCCCNCWPLVTSGALARTHPFRLFTYIGIRWKIDKIVNSSYTCLARSWLTLGYLAINDCC